MASLLPPPIVYSVASPLPAFTSVIPSSHSAGIAMEGKSLFTCHQCGALLKFKYNPVSIEEKISRLRRLQFERQTSASDTPPQALASPSGSDGGEAFDSDISPSERAPIGSPRQITDGSIQTPVIVPEVVWENQRLLQAAPGATSGGSSSRFWSPVAFEHAGTIAAFYSANRGILGHALREVVPARLLNKPHLWLSPEWEIDRTLDGCDADGWIYATDFSGFDPETGALPPASVVQQDGTTSCSSSSDTGEKVVRRRRVVRKRRIDGSDLSWFQELLDCSSLLLKKKTPSCHDCDVVIAHSLQQTLNSLVQDKEQYDAFLAQFVADGDDDGCDDGDDAYDSEEQDPELRALRDEERQLLDELDALELETAQVTQKRQELWSTGKDLEQLVRGTFAEGAFLQHLLGISRDERQSVGVYSVHASDLLRRLQRYNVFNDVFHIWHDGLFGTINGLRLGRLPSKPVEWVEINAALGQAVLLLTLIAERAKFDFVRNKLIARGSFSRVVNKDGREYSLFSDGGMFRRRGFNHAMILLLECVDDAGRRAMHEDPMMKFPYRIQRGKINDLPISLGNDEQWTKALKCMLTHLKWLLAWISKKYP